MIASRAGRLGGEDSAESPVFDSVAESVPAVAELICVSSIAASVSGEVIDCAEDDDDGDEAVAEVEMMVS